MGSKYYDRYEVSKEDKFNYPAVQDVRNYIIQDPRYLLEELGNKSINEVMKPIEDNGNNVTNSNGVVSADGFEDYEGSFGVDRLMRNL